MFVLAVKVLFGVKCAMKANLNIRVFARLSYCDND